MTSKLDINRVNYESMRRLSLITLVVFGSLALFGLIQGYGVYVHRPTVYPPNDSRNNAIIVHLIIAACSIILVTAIQRYRSRKRLPNIWLAPFSQQAFSRFKATILPKPVTFGAIARIIICIPPLYLMLWNPFRSALQITAGLAPSMTANAWGGPTYLGAALAHWLDGLLFMYAAALLLHFIMLKLPKPA